VWLTQTVVDGFAAPIARCAPFFASAQDAFSGLAPFVAGPPIILRDHYKWSIAQVFEPSRPLLYVINSAKILEKGKRCGPH